MLWALGVAACGGSTPKKITTDAAPETGGTLDAAVDAMDTAGAVDQAPGGDTATGETAEAIPHTATMFLPNSLSNFVYRYAITPTGDPALSGMLALEHAQAVALSPGGELLVGDYSGSDRIYRIGKPLDALTAGDPITGLGLNWPQEMRFVDDELWVLNSADHACTGEPQNITRVAFDGTGKASMAGTVTTGLTGANRGLLWVPATRDLFVTQCTPMDAIQHFRVATDHTVTALPAITGMGLANPHGMVMTAWGELLVANFNTRNILRFTVDAQGAATAAGSIDGNGLSSPVGMALTDWGELFVVNQGDGSVSRFTFAADHTAIPNGNFNTHVPSQAGRYGIGWIVLAPPAM